MSLYGSIQMAGNTLQAMQIGLHVVGNNIANANTPGYARERTVFATAPTQKIGNITLGLGVQVKGIVQGVDKFLESRLRDAGGDRASAAIQDTAYGELESILGELTDTDVSTALSNFFSSVNNIVDDPADKAVRNLAAQSGKTLATTINTLAGRVKTMYQDFGQRVDNLGSEINALTEQIRKLNLQIVTQEGGNGLANEAGGLRSQRSVALKRLSEIADVTVNESEAGASNITIGGEFLVFEATRREVKTDFSSQDGLKSATLKFADTNSKLVVGSGELHGLYEARDTVVKGFLDKLDGFAGTLASEFNRVYSQGQGSTGFSSVSSQEAVSSSTVPLDAAGLAVAPQHGTFDVQLYNTRTKLTQTKTIHVNLNGLTDDSTLKSLAADINSIDGIAAEVTSDNRLKIRAESGETTVAFGKDTSGALASLGINTFFTGSTAAGLGVNDVVLADGSKFAGALGGVGVDVGNVLKLVGLNDAGLTGLGGDTITGAYDQLVNDVSQGATVAKSVKSGFETFEATLEANAQAVSGVNLDEEAVDLILLQRTYQASAKFISTISDLLDVLVKL